MEREQIRTLCLQKEQELIDKYFGNLVYEAAIEQPETIGEYSKELPLKIEMEYYNYLEYLWKEYMTNNKQDFSNIIDKRHLRMLSTEDDIEAIEYAYNDATRQTLWERLTKSNHKDVTYYKGLLKEYTKELLSCLRCDFLEEF